ncbi:MAG: hypothetical protein ACRD2Q_02020 [Terriglobales bacterium]
MRIASLSGILVVVALTFLLPPVAPQQDRAASERHVIFAVWKSMSGEGSAPRGSRPFIDAVAVVDGGRYLPPPPPWFEPGKDLAPEALRFEEQYFASGKKYAVYIGGEHAGTVEVIKPETITCASLSAVVRGTGALEDDDVRALATSLPISPRTPAASRRPTPEEEAAALELAGSVFRVHGARSSALRRIRIERLVLSDLDRDQRAEMVGTFSLRDKAERTLLLVAGPGDKGFKAEMAWHYLSSGAADDHQQRSLVDHLDLDGDGVDELIVRMEDHEGWQYGIYKKDKKGWKLVYTGGGGGC